MRAFEGWSGRFRAATGRLRDQNGTRRLRSEGGLALTELLVAATVSIVLFGVAVQAFGSFVGQDRRNDKQAQAQRNARQAVDRMAAQLRNAQGPSGYSPVYSKTSYELIFYTPSESASLTNNAHGLQWVRYCLDYSTASNEKLWMLTAPYDSTVWAYPGWGTTACPGTAGWTTKQIVADKLVNHLSSPYTPLFKYTTDTSATTFVFDVAVDALVDADTTNNQAATDLKSSVNLRNTDHSPKAVMTCGAVSSSSVVCDASASSDPDGDAISFQWQYSPCGSYPGSIPPTTCPWRPGETGYTLNASGLTSGTTYTFICEVTDPHGMFQDVFKTVTMP
jgi:type II secretory pathway pseudopilin PulG